MASNRHFATWAVRTTLDVIPTEVVHKRPIGVMPPREVWVRWVVLVDLTRKAVKPFVVGPVQAPVRPLGEHRPDELLGLVGGHPRRVR